MTKKQKKMLVRILITAVMLIALKFIPITGIPQLLAYVAAYLVIGYDILRKAGKGILNGRAFDENFLMTLATLGAFFLAIWTKSGDYVEGIAVMLFYQIGELFQSYAVGKSRRNITALMDIRPDYANIEQDGKLVPVHQTAEYKEALDWMRKIYADGLVRPDWATVDTANFQVDSQKGVTGVFVDTMDGTKRIWKYFEDNAIADVNDASKIATMTSVGPINGHTLATTGYNGFYLITKSGAKTEEDVKACLHFLDKMCDPEMMALADYGLKDICYDINENGKIVPNGKYDTTNCPHAGLNQAVPYVPYLTEQNPDYQLEKADYQQAYEESIANNVQYAVFNPALGYLTQSDTYAECGSDLVQILDDARTQYICGQIDEAGLQAAFDQWNARGGTQVIEEVNALYAADKA